MAYGPGEAVVRLLQRPGGVRGRHLGQRGPDVLDGQILQKDRPDDGKERSQRVPVNLDRLGGTPRKPLRQPVGNGLLHGVPLHRPDARVQLGVQLLEPVLDLSLGLAADLLADPLSVRAEAERNHASPAPVTGPVVGAVPAVRAVIEVDAVFAVAVLSHPM